MPKAYPQGKTCGELLNKLRTMTEIEQYIKEKLEDIDLHYVGDLEEKVSDYLFHVQVMSDQEINFDNTIFTVSSIDYNNVMGCYLTLKVQASLIKHCVDKVTPFN